MKDVLNAMVQAVGDQAIALGAAEDRLAVLKRTLAREFPDLADELKTQMEADQEQSRKNNYDLQVSLAKIREAIIQLSDAEAKLERKRPASKASTRSAGNRAKSR